MPLTILLIVAAGSFAILQARQYFARQAEVQYAKYELMPEIRHQLEVNWRDFTETYELASQVQETIPDDPELADIFDRISLRIDIDSDPAGADVYVKKYQNPDLAWTHLIDSNRLAYYGMSWGALMGGIIPAIEGRLKTAMVLAVGIYESGLPEANPLNYVPRISMPFLMMVGRYDSILDHESMAKPMFEMFGTPDEHKVLKIYETDYIPPKNEYVK
jgi:pimeloyl-ACP methyl ester carboxylesterase